MSRGLSTAIKNAFAGSAYQTATLVKLDLNTDRFFTNAPMTITYDSNDYVSTGLFLDLADLEENSTLTTGAFQMRLTSVSTGVLDDLLTYGYVDRPVNVYIALLDSDMAVIDAPFEYFAGVINSFQVGETNTTSVLTLQVGNNWTQHDKINGRYLTDTSQKRYFSGDKAFEYVPQTGRQLEWGIEKN